MALVMQLSMLGPTPKYGEGGRFDLPCNQIPYPGAKIYDQIIHLQLYLH